MNNNILNNIEYLKNFKNIYIIVESPSKSKIFFNTISSIINNKDCKIYALATKGHITKIKIEKIESIYQKLNINYLKNANIIINKIKSTYNKDPSQNYFILILPKL